RVSEQSRLFDAQQFGRADLFRLGDILRISLAAAPAALRIGPTYPPAGPVLARVAAVSFLGRLCHELILFSIVLPEPAQECFLRGLRSPRLHSPVDVHVVRQVAV